MSDKAVRLTASEFAGSTGKKSEEQHIFDHFYGYFDINSILKVLITKNTHLIEG